MGAFSSTEACELPDLSIDVNLSENAELPMYETPGRGGMTLYASADTTLSVGEKGHVPTGVTVRLPFMLIGMVVNDTFPNVEISTRVIDFDWTSPIVLEATYRPTTIEHPDTIEIKRGDKLGMLVILPIARPGLRVARPASNDDEAVEAHSLKEPTKRENL